MREQTQEDLSATIPEEWSQKPRPKHNWFRARPKRAETVEEQFAKVKHNDLLIPIFYVFGALFLIVAGLGFLAWMLSASTSWVGPFALAVVGALCVLVASIKEGFENLRNDRLWEEFKGK